LGRVCVLYGGSEREGAIGTIIRAASRRAAVHTDLWYWEKVRSYSYDHNKVSSMYYLSTAVRFVSRNTIKSAAQYHI
jgi:hypothetical protein